jgi:hypothetical protein
MSYTSFGGKSRNDADFAMQAAIPQAHIRGT